MKTHYMLSDIHGDISNLKHLFTKKDIVELINHDSMKVYYDVSLSYDKFYISELPTTTARAEIILPAIKNLVDKYGEDLDFLDLACSPGYFMFKVAKGLHVKNLVGVDARNVHLNQFKFLNSFYQYQNIQFIHSDIYSFLEKEILIKKQYDICFLFGFLYHTSTPVELLRSIKKVCKRCLIIDTTLSLRKSSTLLIYKERINWARASTSNISFMPSLKAIPLLLEAAGFRKIERIIPSRTLEANNPGGNNIDYYFDQGGFYKQFVPLVKQLIFRIQHKLHIQSNNEGQSPRAIFIAYV